MSKKMEDVNRHLPKKPTIAIVGINGWLGGYVVNALTSAPFADKITFPIHIATRKKTDKKIAPGQFKYFEISSFDGEEDLVRAFEGADVVIDLTALNADHIKILNAAVMAKDPQIFIAPEFGADNDEIPYHVFDSKRAVVKAAAETNLKTVSICTGAFADIVIQTPSVFGINFDTGSATIIDNGDMPVSVSFVADIGKVIASVATTPIDRLASKYHIQSDVITTQKMIDIYEKASGHKLKVDHIHLGDARTEAHHIDKRGPQSPEEFYKILRTIAAEGKGLNFSHNNHNDDINPDIWDWTSFEERAQMAWKKK